MYICIYIYKYVYTYMERLAGFITMSVWTFFFTSWEIFILLVTYLSQGHGKDKRYGLIAHHLPWSLRNLLKLRSNCPSVCAAGIFPRPPPGVLCVIGHGRLIQDYPCLVDIAGCLLCIALRLPWLRQAWRILHIAWLIIKATPGSQKAGSYDDPHVKLAGLLNAHLLKVSIKGGKEAWVPVWGYCLEII